MVVLARQMGQWGKSMPGRGKGICKGPGEEGRTWYTAGSASSLLQLEHRIGTGERSLFLAIPLWARLDSDFFFFLQ